MTLLERPVRGSKSGRPLMVLLDLLSRRWALRVLWELRDGAVGFRDLQARCDGMSPSVLNQRLSELKDHRIVETDAAGAYRLSAQGRQLLDLFGPITQWTGRWARGLRRAGTPRARGTGAPA